MEIQSKPDYSKYFFHFPAIRNNTLTLMLKEIKQMSEFAQFRVHYNRSGEV